MNPKERLLSDLFGVVSRTHDRPSEPNGLLPPIPIEHLERHPTVPKSRARISHLTRHRIRFHNYKTPTTKRRFRADSDT